MQHGRQEFGSTIIPDGNGRPLGVGRTDAALCVGFLDRGMLFRVAPPSECSRSLGTICGQPYREPPLCVPIAVFIRVPSCFAPVLVVPQVTYPRHDKSLP